MCESNQTELKLLFFHQLDSTTANRNKHPCATMAYNRTMKAINYAQVFHNMKHSRAWHNHILHSTAVLSGWWRRNTHHMLWTVIHATVPSLSLSIDRYLLSSSCCNSSRRFCSNSFSLISLSDDSTVTCEHSR